jgi:hypothetical protein
MWKREKLKEEIIDFDFYARSAFERNGKKISSNQLSLEYHNFVKLNPINQSIAIAKKFESRQMPEDLDLLISMMIESLKFGKGFSFLRMGDGEGRFVTGYEEYPAITDFSIALSMRIWWDGCKKLPHFTDWCGSLSTCYKNATLVGYSPVYRVTMNEVWYGHYGVINGNNFINSYSQNQDYLIRNWTHVELWDDKRFTHLLKFNKVAVITCHSKQVLEDSGLFPDLIEVINIPPQPGLGLNNYSNSQEIYPSLFEEILDKIPKLEANILICSAGVHAKFFCESARISGKIGIDIGSELDKRLGFKTR